LFAFFCIIHGSKKKTFFFSCLLSTGGKECFFAFSFAVPCDIFTAVRLAKDGKKWYNPPRQNKDLPTEGSGRSI
jgi:hypothetical protein